MNVTEVEKRESTKHCCSNGCRRRDSAEHEENGGALIDKRITESNATNADRKVDGLLEIIVSNENLNRAYQRVKRNKGAGGVDGMEVNELLQYLKDNGEKIRKSILAGTYQPAPVRRVEIPKENGKKRKLGIPTAVDRVIQQAIAQILTPIYEEKFVETSYGFRPGKSAHDALLKCQTYLEEGYVWTVDMDLEKFFDTVNQSKLIQVLSKDIKDGRVISLIHKYLKAGAVWCEKFEETGIGVPQGGPLSPLCGNIMLNELDQELRNRGHRFVRYADDMVIFCKSKASAKQTLTHIIPYIEKKLFLKVNREKTNVSYAGKIKFLGYGFYKSRLGFRMRVHGKSKEKMKAKVKELTSRRNIQSYEEWKRKMKQFIVGWINYYKLADMENLLKETDEWMRRRIRMVFWKCWKRVKTRYRNLESLGISKTNAGILANTRKGYWRTASSPILKAALTNQRIEKDGFQFFNSYYKSVIA
ncbi:group II intron reverse transcriptase/maturase [Lacrimispora sp.]|uniref:group II intron reverse transcriptase/maturase n=1 Tax=Lacrimispora sp. TaxID=2719234 RepID=UPI0028966FB3|nr:group II intron reverse transcriptase/maturase [Lacrimispora sp.]